MLLIITCHTQDVERMMKLVTIASRKVCRQISRDGYVRAALQSRKVILTFNIKNRFQVKFQENFKISRKFQISRFQEKIVFKTCFRRNERTGWDLVSFHMLWDQQTSLSNFLKENSISTVMKSLENM